MSYEEGENQYYYARDNSIEIHLKESNSPYVNTNLKKVLIPSTMKPDEYSTYTLTLFHKQLDETVQSDIMIKKINDENDDIKKIVGKWKNNNNNGGCFINNTWKNNPKIKLEVLEDIDVLTIALTQQYKDQFNAIGINVFKNEVNAKNLVYSCEEYLKSCYVTHTMKDMKKGNEPYFIMPTRFDNDIEIDFEMIFFTDKKNEGAYKITYIENTEFLISDDDELKLLPKQKYNYPDYFVNQKLLASLGI
jgi:hypothetical protein